MIRPGHERQIALVATVDYSGRGFFTEINVVTRTTSGLARDRIATGGAAAWPLASALKDLNDDGIYELVTPESVGPYHGAAAVAVFPHVYSRTPSGFRQQDRRFQSYYRDQWLPSIAAQIKALDRSGSGQPGVAEKEYRIKLERERELAERFLSD